jgi:methanogenic corrinoid protein MtbC1
MVADFFEMEGWDTYYVGANTPVDSILQTLQERQADVLGISSTMHYHVNAVKVLVDQVRASDVGQRVKVLVGGYPFNLHPDLWRKVGADGCGQDAQEAVALANRLLDV